jgi:hypothetical protein
MAIVAHINDGSCTYPRFAAKRASPHTEDQKKSLKNRPSIITSFFRVCRLRTPLANFGRPQDRYSGESHVRSHLLKRPLSSPVLSPQSHTVHLQ